jgi:hypothetical protein
VKLASPSPEDSNVPHEQSVYSQRDKPDLLVRGERAMLVEIARFFSYLIRFSDDFAYENQKKSLTSS